MPKKPLSIIEYCAISILIGILFGLLIGATIRYPVNIDKIQKYQLVCGNQKIALAKITITGDVRSITCQNGIEVNVD